MDAFNLATTAPSTPGRFFLQIGWAFSPCVKVRSPGNEQRLPNIVFLDTTQLVHDNEWTDLLIKS